MSTPPERTRRRHLLIATVGLAAGGALLGGYLWRRPAAGPAVITDFVPPDEDLCVAAPDDDSGDLGHSFAYLLADDASRLLPRTIPAQARCPVCGMYPARYLKWGAQLIHADGSTHFFDSPADLLLFMREPARYAKDHTAQIPATDAAAIYVTDFDSGQWVAAREAWFVLGSSIKGPMRTPDLPAFARRADAEALVGQHGGSVLDYSAALAEQTLTTLRGTTHAGHAHP